MYNLWMIRIVRNTTYLSLVVLAASACGMNGGGNSPSASAQPSTWFEYAYYSSPATLEADGMDKEVLDYSKARMRIY